MQVLYRERALDFKKCFPKPFDVLVKKIKIKKYLNFLQIIEFRYDIIFSNDLPPINKYQQQKNHKNHNILYNFFLFLIRDM